MMGGKTNEQKLSDLKSLILHENKNIASFVVIGKTLYNLYYVDKLVKNQREFLTWTKTNLGFSKSTTYEYIISYKVYNDISQRLPPEYQPPLYQSHCQLLAKVPEDQLVSVWIQVNERAPNGVITTSLLESLLQELNFKPMKKTPRKRQKVAKYESSEDELEDEGYVTPDTPQPEPPQQSTPPKKRLSRMPIQAHSLPFDPELVFELGKSVVSGQFFDNICFSAREFQQIEQELYGRIFCNLSELKPFSKRYLTVDGIERYLRIIFTRYANKEYNEGIFVIRGEFGSDWFTPILQHPFCILRQKQDLDRDYDFSSYIVFYMGPNVQEFCQCFKNIGFLPGYNIWSWSQNTSPQRIAPHLIRVESTPREEEFLSSDYLNVDQSSGDLSKAASALCNMTQNSDDSH